MTYQGKETYTYRLFFASLINIAAERAAIHDVTVQRVQAWNDKDVEHVLSFNTEDSSWFPPNAPIVMGKQPG